MSSCRSSRRAKRSRSPNFWRPPSRAALKPIFVDGNAVDVATVMRIAAIATAAGAPFVDGCIIGGPPKPGEAGPTIYLSGAAAADAAAIVGALGLVTRVMDAPVGAASALKMSYAGITKGLTGLAAAMVLAASRAGAAEALHAELAASQPQLLQRFGVALPDMLPKAYRWVAEMREISAFAGEDPAAQTIYLGLAELYARIAGDFRRDGDEIASLRRFLALSKHADG